MGHRERRERTGFLAGKEHEGMYFDEYEAEFSKECSTEFDKRLNYVFKAPEILEKAWKMPWKESWKGELKPVLTIYGDNVDALVDFYSRAMDRSLLLYTTYGGKKSTKDCYKEAIEAIKNEKGGILSEYLEKM